MTGSDKIISVDKDMYFQCEKYLPRTWIDAIFDNNNSIYLKDCKHVKMYAVFLSSNTVREQIRKDINNKYQHVDLAVGVITIILPPLFVAIGALAMHLNSIWWLTILMTVLYTIAAFACFFSRNECAIAQRTLALNLFKDLCRIADS